VIELTDPKWSELSGNYSNGVLVAGLIAKAQAGTPVDGWYDDLFQELCHQYTVSEAAYAAVPHLVKIAATPDAPSMDLLILLGACYANSDSPIPTGLEEDWHVPTRQVIPLPVEYEEDWHSTANEAITLLAQLLAEPHSEDELRYLFASMAAFQGYQWLAKKLETLDVDADWNQ
jgi:hypothetical protein